jgi:uncharacterized phiE125 gp8 family phage protein
MTAALITPPAVEPVSLDDARAHLRIDGSDDDALISSAIVSARAHVEALTRRALVEQGWRVYLDAWPRRRIIRVPVTPLISVDAITVYDGSGDPTTLTTEYYDVDVATGRILMAAGVPLPTRHLNGIEIDITAGYGATSIDVPTPLRRAVLMLVAHWYEHRGVVGHDMAGSVPPQGFDALIAPYRVLWL